MYLIGPHKNLRGGISTVINQLVNSQYLKNNYEISDIATFKNHKLIDYFKSIIKILKLKNGSIIHIHMASDGSFYRKAMLIKLIKLINRSSKVLIHIHGGYFGLFYDSSNKYVKKLIKDILNKADIIICVSNSLKRDIKKILPESNNIKVVYNSISNINNEISLYSKKNNIIFMGKLVEYKGIYDLLNCLADIKKDIIHAKWKVIIAGNGEIDKVRNSVDLYKINEIVEIKGWVEGREKDNILKYGKILVMPSYIESFGISCLEAMNYGLAIICSNVGGLPEIVSEQNGIIISPGNKELLKKAITKLIKEESSVKRMAENNIKRAREFNEENMVHNIDAIYKSLI